MKGTLKIQVEPRDPGGVHVALVGSLDGHTFDQFRKSMTELIAGGAVRFVLDLSKMEYVASVGINYLVNFRVQQRKAGGEVVLARPQAHVLRIFKMLGLTEVLVLTQTPEEAWSILKSRISGETSGPALID
jgi:anti-sigma B factor antagonist